LPFPFRAIDIEVYGLKKEVRSVIPAQLSWERNGHSYAASLEELDAKVDELEEEARQQKFPFVVQVLLDDGSGDGMHFMVGSEYSILTYFSSMGNDRLCNALGNPEDEPILIAFSFWGAYTEARASRMVSNKKARDALREYVLHKRIPDDVHIE
jgi:Immunity protein Imm1